MDVWHRRICTSTYTYVIAHVENVIMEVCTSQVLWLGNSRSPTAGFLTLESCTFLFKEVPDTLVSRKSRPPCPVTLSIVDRLSWRRAYTWWSGMYWNPNSCLGLGLRVQGTRSGIGHVLAETETCFRFVGFWGSRLRVFGLGVFWGLSDSRVIGFRNSGLGKV